MRYLKVIMYFATEGKSTDKAKLKASQLLGGYTLTNHEGGWLNNGDVVEEVSYSLTFILMDEKTEQIKELATYIKDHYNQSEVWVTRQEVTNLIY
jgi:hypothetical protein